MIINAILAIGYGVALLIFTGPFQLLYGLSPDEPLKYNGQLFGGALIGFALLTWKARNAADSDARKAIVFALFFTNVIGFIVTLNGQLNNVLNQLGWSAVVVYLFLSLGWGYFQFLKPSSS
jgi:hypothetical protein